MNNSESGKPPVRVHLLTMEPGERFSIGDGPEPPVFTLVVRMVKDEKGLDKAIRKARDAAGTDHSLEEIYIGNGQSYAVDPVPAGPATEGGGT